MDIERRLDNMRLTEPEWEEVAQVSLRRITPTAETPPLLLRASDTVEEARKLVASAGSIVGLSTGFHSLDRMTKGMAGGDLIIVYGDTSHGKSQLTQNITYKLASKGTPVLFVGLEMTNAQNTTRFIGIGADDDETTQITTLNNILYPSDNDLNYDTIESHIAAAVAEGVKLVVIDQLQQLTRSVDNVTNETSQVTHALKRAAVAHDIPIILISHINRTGNTGAAPTLRELKGSSSIEQDADICLAVWRNMDPREGKLHILEVWLRKNRNRGMEEFMTELGVSHGVKLYESLITVMAGSVEV